MHSNATPQILLTGATGYIGGSILTHLLNSASPTFKDATITCLVRGPDRVTKLSSVYGNRVRTVLYKDLDDTEATITAAAQHDIVINTTLGFHSESAQALIRGLARRKAATGRNVWMIHTSGTSNLADQPISKNWVHKDTDCEFDDTKDDIYSFEKERERLHPYHQRTAELGVIDLGLEVGVETLVIMSPTIFGIGRGLFNTTSIQIPAYVKVAMSYGRAVVIGEGNGVWDHVHVQDLAELYGLIVLDLLENGGNNLPKGKCGIIFSGNGRHTWKEVAQGVANACYEEGVIKDKEVQSISLTQAAEMLASFVSQDEKVIELGLASNSRTVSSVAKSLGWNPTKGADSWERGFRDDVKTVLQKNQN